MIVYMGGALEAPEQQLEDPSGSCKPCMGLYSQKGRILMFSRLAQLPPSGSPLINQL